MTTSPQIEADELEALLSELPGSGRERLLHWYRRDDNAVPAEHCLQPRDGRFRDGAAWETEERELRALLNGAIERLGWAAADTRRVGYEASATHQEILQGALAVDDASEHVFGFFRTIEGLPEGDAARQYVDLEPDGRPDEEARRRLEQLKAALRTRLGDNIHAYSATWTDAGPSADHLERLCVDVYGRLSEAIELEIGRRDKGDPAEEEAGAGRAG